MQRGLALFVLLVSYAGAMAGEFMPFTASAGTAGSGVTAQVLQGRHVIVRFRTGGNAALVAARNLAVRLNQAAVEGVRPADITVAPEPAGRNRQGDKMARGALPGAVIKVRGQVLVTVTPEEARQANTTPLLLANSWASNLRTRFQAAYVAVQEPELAVPWAETRMVRYGGRFAGRPSVAVQSPDIAEARLDEEKRLVLVRGLAVGTSAVSIRAGDSEARLIVVVRKWAARITSPIRVGVTGPQGPNLWLERAVRVTSQAALQPEPGARGVLSSLTLVGRAGTAVLEARGPDYFDVIRRVPVELVPAEVPADPPVRSILSNDPEKVGTTGLLARARLNALEPVHFLWHHINGGTGKLGVVVRLCNSGEQTARVHVIGAECGPSGDEVYVGHVTMRRFVDAVYSNAGAVFVLPARSRCDLSRLPMPPGRIVSGLARIMPLSGEGLFVETEAVPAADTGGALEPVPADLTPQSATPSLELPGHKVLEAHQQVGRAWKFVHIGRSPEDAKLHPRLRGDYGVLHEARIVFDNPEQTPARLEIALRAGGGVARAVVEVNGNVRETGLLSEGSEEILFKETTDARERRVRIRLIPQSGSNYPLTITARSFPK